MNLIKSSCCGVTLEEQLSGIEDLSPVDRARCVALLFSDFFDDMHDREISLDIGEFVDICIYIYT